MKHQKLLIMIALIILVLIFCACQDSNPQRLSLEKSEPSEWVKEWVENDYRVPVIDHPRAYYKKNIDNPRIGMHKNEFVPEFISFDEFPIIMSSRYTSSQGVMEIWQYGPSLRRPQKKLTFLNDKLITIFEH